jgi:AraC-like DNA-binding protein
MDFENVQVFRSAPRSVTASLSVVEYGRQKVRAEIKNRKLADYAAVFVEKGRGSLTTELGGTQRVIGPALFWLMPDHLHSYGPDANTSWHERWTLFRGSMVEEFVTDSLMVSAQPLVPITNTSEIIHTFGMLHSEMLRRDAIGWASAAAAVHRLVVQAASQQSTHPHVKDNIKSNLIKKRIEAQAFGELGLERLAQELNIAPATLRRKSNAILGKAPKHYQLQLRIDRAKELLTMTTKSIEEIAGSVGYQDSFYFSRLFFKREGRSPSEFRKLHARK